MLVDLRLLGWRSCSSLTQWTLGAPQPAAAHPSPRPTASASSAPAHRRYRSRLTVPTGSIRAETMASATPPAALGSAEVPPAAAAAATATGIGSADGAGPEPKDTRYPFPISMLQQALQDPPLDRQLGVHVAHVMAHRAGMASEVLAELLEVPQELVLRLIWFGAVYCCPVAPLPHRDRIAGVPAEQMARIQAVRKAGLARWGKDSRHQTPRRLAADEPVTDNSYLRAHCHPKRFPIAHSLSSDEWRRRLLAVAPDHVVVSKPPGLQVPPTVDNVQESLLACVERVMSLAPGSLQPAHRLDAGTEGVVVLARSSAAFAAYFRTLMADKGQTGVQKIYRCLVASPPPPERVGPSASASASTSAPGGCSLVHWVLEDQRAAGEMAHTVVVPEGTPGALRCELRLEQVEHVELNDEAAALWGCREAHEVTVRLVTGRTHQVRVQLAALGHPLLGDLLYGALAARDEVQRRRSSESGEQQQQQGVQQDGPQGQQQAQQQAQQEHVRGQAADWCKPALDQQLAPVALQAHSLEVLQDGPMGPGPVLHSAGDPWWRRKA